MEPIQQRHWPVQWHEGMLLSPQHFQQDQIYRESQRLHELVLLQPFYWGLHDISIDPSALLEGKILIKRAYGVMPDGLVLDYNDAVDPPLLLDLAGQESVKEGGDSVPVFLAVPIRTAGAASQSAAIQRFDSISGDTVIDENTGAGDVEIARLRPKLEILAAQRAPARYVSLPAFRVLKDVDGAYKLSTYVPPLLRLREGAFLGQESLSQRITRRINEAREKALRLHNLSRSDASGLSANDRMQKHMLAQRLTAALPRLEVLLESRHAHPFAVYQALAEWAGSLAGLADNPVPSKFPRYDHNNIIASVGPVLAYIENIVGRIDVTYSLIRFDEDRKGLYSVPLPARLPPSGRLTLEFRLAQGGSETALREFVKKARIATETAYKRTVQQRLLGAARTPVARQPGWSGETQPGRVVVELQVDKQFIQPGERLIVASSERGQKEHAPESIWLYSAHAPRG